ncbi:MAG: flagellar motor switch protein FliM [Spirochaetes bacterium GWF1_51_8]|nr:MAG: flagellar motor switch protein FliM [Spirochaetes bacterium GWF1_51_8]
MTEILSQDEIDALLTAVSSGESLESEPMSAPSMGGGGSQSVKPGREKKRLKVYDFRRPDKFSKDQIRTLQMMHETFARLTTTSLSANLRTLVHVHVVSVDQLTYDEFTRSIPSPTTLGIINMDPLKGSSVIEVDPSVTFAIIDRLFGGKGEPLKTNRELTDIELSVIEGIIVRLLGNLRESWANVIDLRPRLGNIETNPQFAQIVPPTSMVVLTTFDTKVGDVEGMMNFCIPYITIEPIISKLSAQYWYSSIRKGITTENLNLIKEQISDVRVDVTAKLSEAELKFREIAAIREGDIIRLNGSIKADVEILIGNSVKFRGKAGMVGKRVSIQIQEVVSLIDEEMLQDILMGEEE